MSINDDWQNIYSYPMTWQKNDDRWSKTFRFNIVSGIFSTFMQRRSAHDRVLGVPVFCIHFTQNLCYHSNMKMKKRRDLNE